MNLFPEEPVRAKFYHELHKLVYRWKEESDISYYEMIGALEALKADMMDALAKANSREKNE